MSKLLYALFVVHAAASSVASARPSLDDAVSYVAQQAKRTNSLHPIRTQYPDRVTDPEVAGGALAEWKLAHAPGGWTSGFWPGVNWHLAALTGDEGWATVAKAYNVGLKPNQFNNRTHDVGFMMYPSYGLGHRAEPGLRADYGPVIFGTAMSLAERFNAKVGCTESWSPGKHCNAQSAHRNDECKFTVIIDNMMNLEILTFAALNVSDADCGGCTAADRTHLLHVANTHAATATANHVRPDGSIEHIECYDPATGARDFGCNGGGFLDNTTWARGEAWALYGFTMMHRYTGNPAYLATATKLADFFTNAVTTRFKDNVPDFDLTYTGLAPYTNLSRRDASAAAIAASGLVELSTYVGPADGKRYRAYADAAIEALSTAPYKSDFAATEGAVMHCDAADCDVPWADFYLLEAIRRAKCLAAGAPCF